MGDNNVGKTTIFNSLEFLTAGGKKEDFITKGRESANVSITVTLSNVSEFKDSLKKYNSYIDKGELILQRSSQSKTIKQGKKDVKLDIKKITVFNPQEMQFENPTGISSTITNLIDPQIIYADIHNEDYQDFGTTKTTGKLIQSATKSFQKNPLFTQLQEAHAKAFGRDGIQNELNVTEKEIEEILLSQFGESQIKFNFQFPNVNDLLKKGGISVTENGVQTDISEKGNGLQRALALAIIQVFSKFNDEENKSQYLIDEPEIYLHPKAQDKLLDSLVTLSEEGNQIFITTHSPYVLRHYRDKDDSIIILTTKSKNKEISSIDSLFFKPTSIGEVTYRAFSVPTVDFHQRLFTELYLYWINSHNPKKPSLRSFDNNFLVSECSLDREEFFPRYNGNWKDSEQQSLPYIVRNEIDHPELIKKGKNVWSEENLQKSIDCLMDLYKKFIAIN